jgi:hypothetical protein
MRTERQGAGTRHWGTIVATLALGACSTPQHSNTLVFGTTTRLALDVSQDPTSTVGITIGYKRQEAVWMPLLPNQADTDGKTRPMACNSTHKTTEADGTIEVKTNQCEWFAGRDDHRGRDTYSVLASFGSKLGGGADATNKDVKARGEIAQYFATGLAARLLAQNGAALVNTSGDGLTTEQRATLEQQSTTAVSELEQVVTKSTATDGKSIDAAKVQAAFAKPPGSAIPASMQAAISQAATPADLREVLSAYRYERAVKPMLQTLNN